LKILFTIDSLQQGGAEQSLISLIRNFPTETELTVLYFFPKNDLLSEFESLNIRLISVGLQSKYAWWQGMRVLSKTIAKEEPDVVVSCLYWSNIVSRMVCKRMRVPLVGTFVSDSYSEQRTNHFSFTRKLAFRFFKQLDRWTAGIPVHWIANSVSIKNSNAQVLKIDPTSIEVVYRGRDVRAFKLWQSPPMHPFRFVFVGRLLETKGLRELVESFAQLSAAHESVQLDIYGDGPFRLEVESLIKKYKITDKVIMHGRVPNAWQHLYACHCFVFPSWYEGFSGALVEAMMTGIPIIASDIPMNLEAVSNNKTAQVFKVREANHLFEKMQQVLGNFSLAQSMGAHAREEAFKRFDQKNISNQYVQLLAKAAKKSI
jgi:glycosyltransferase involved in cell wall biosynthesis